jgi:hypothetical protein
VSEELIVPLTGELVPLAEPDRVARALADLRDLEQQIADAKDVLRAALIEEGRRRGTKTLHLAGVEVKIGSERKLVWDVSKLLELRDAGLPEDRLTALITETVEYKVDRGVVRELEGSGNEHYARIIAEARGYEPVRRPWVGVERVALALPAGEDVDG